jgi:hypothetical protein
MTTNSEKKREIDDGRHNRNYKAEASAVPDETRSYEKSCCRPGLYLADEKLTAKYCAGMLFRIFRKARHVLQ